MALFLLLLAPVYAQPVGKEGINTNKPLDALTMDKWSTEDGLISNNLTSVFQSSSNFLWITTFNGIQRFDGISFKLYDKTIISSLSSNGFYKTFEDSKGNLWFCSQSSGIVKYSSNVFEQVLPEGKNSLSVRSIAEGDDGKIWIGTNNEGLFVYENKLLSKVNLDEFENLNIMDLLVGDEGALYLATINDGLLKYVNGDLTKIAIGEGLENNALNTMTKAEDGTIYIGTLDGLYYVGASDKGSIDALKGVEINDIVIDDYENIWIAAEQGLFMINLADNVFKSFTPENGLPGAQVSGLTFDHENSLWLSTKKAGLIRLRNGFFNNLGLEDGLSSRNVNIITEDNGLFYIGCDDGNINIYDGKKISRLGINDTKYNLGIRDIQIGDDGEILIASYRGLLRKKGNKETIFDLNKYGASNDVRRILKGKNGSIWLASRSSGVIQVTPSNEVKLYNSSNSLKSDYILALEQNANGDIYAGTHSGGLSIVRADGTVENHPIEGGKSGILIFNIHHIDNQRLWVCTNIGVYKFENESFKKVELDEKLNAETIFDLVVINEFAWLSSNIGVIRVSLSDLEAYFNGAFLSVPGRLFDRFDGMASQECTGATRMTLSKDKKLWVPTLGGVAILDPSDVIENRNIPQVYITDFLTDFQSRSVTEDRIIIEPNVVRYQFNFTSLSFIAPPKVQFRYKLSGIDNNWVEAGNEREVIYTNLSHGNYTFTVIGSNNDGVWNEQGASIKFKVNPYFYETTLFYIGVVVLIGLLIWGVIVWRVHNVEKRNAELKKLNEELDRFVYSASHDLRAPLSSVLGLVEIARLETTVEAKQQCLDMINASVVKLDGFINDIIDYSRNQRIDIQPENVDIQEEVNEALTDLKYLDKDNKIEKIVEIEGDRKFVTDGRRLNVILKNIISNAIRYHNFEQSNPYIKIKISYAIDAVIITISDNGIGIDHSHLENIFKMFYRADESSKGSGLGLYIVKETIDKLGGKIDVESQLNFGTTFTITLPRLKLQTS